MIDERLYTVRWIANKILGTSVENSTQEAAKEMASLLTEIIGDRQKVGATIQIPTSDLPKSTKGATVIPFAVQSKVRMRTKGKFDGGWPKGILVHWTDGWWNKGLNNALNTIEQGAGQGYAYHCIAFTGEIVQAHAANEWNYHAGESAWKRGVAPLVGSVSDDLQGIEINCAGKLVEKDGKLYPDFAIGKVEIPKSEARYVTEAEYGCPTGWYQKFSPEIESALIKTIFWYKDNDPTGRFTFDNVLAHHEVSGKLGIGWFRKSDCGGSLSMPMPAFREYLKQEYKKRG